MWCQHLRQKLWWNLPSSYAIQLGLPGIWQPLEGIDLDSQWYTYFAAPVSFCDLVLIESLFKFSSAFDWLCYVFFYNIIRGTPQLNCWDNLQGSADWSLSDSILFGWNIYLLFNDFSDNKHFKITRKISSFFIRREGVRCIFSCILAVKLSRNKRNKFLLAPNRVQWKFHTKHSWDSEVNHKIIIT